MIVPAEQVTVTLPHSLCAVMLVAQTGRFAGLQPKSVVVFTQLSNTGAVATVQVNVLEQVELSPQPVAV